MGVSLQKDKQDSLLSKFHKHAFMENIHIHIFPPSSLLSTHKKKSKIIIASICSDITAPNKHKRKIPAAPQARKNQENISTCFSPSPSRDMQQQQEHPCHHNQARNTFLRWWEPVVGINSSKTNPTREPGPSKRQWMQAWATAQCKQLPDYNPPLIFCWQWSQPCLSLYQWFTTFSNLQIPPPPPKKKIGRKLPYIKTSDEK